MRRQLINYVPHVLRDVKEFITIMSSEQPEVDKLWDCLTYAMNDQFIPSATSYGVSRWEAMLGITPKKSETLEERKYRVLLRLNERIPYTYRALLRYLAALSEKYDVYLNHDAYSVLVSVVLNGYVPRDELMSALRRMIPANLSMAVEFLQENQLPPRTLHITGIMGRGYMSTRLPLREYSAPHDTTQRISAAGHSIMQTRLPDRTKEENECLYY